MIKSKIKIIFPLFLFFILTTYCLLLTTLSAQAADTDGLVPCSGLDCKFCDLTKLVGRVINFALYYIAIPLVAVMIVWGGLVIMTAGDDSGKVSEGRKIIQAAAIGLAVALGAWVIISEILIAIGPSDTGGKLYFQPWKWGDIEFCKIE